MHRGPSNPRSGGATAGGWTKARPKDAKTFTAPAYSCRRLTYAKPGEGLFPDRRERHRHGPEMQHSGELAVRAERGFVLDVVFVAVEHDVVAPLRVRARYRTGHVARIELRGLARARQRIAFLRERAPD